MTGAKDTQKHYEEEGLNGVVCAWAETPSYLYCDSSLLPKLEHVRRTADKWGKHTWQPCGLGPGEWCFRSSPSTAAQKVCMGRSPGSAHQHLLSAAMPCLTVVWRATWCFTEMPLRCVSSFDVCYLQSHSRHTSDSPEGLEEKLWPNSSWSHLAWYFNAGCIVEI